MTFQDPRLVRTDDAWLTLPNAWGVPVDICAGADVPVEPAAVDEALSVLETADTLARLGDAAITRLVLTPDFHKGAGIPIGTVLQTRGALLPQAVGNDVNCGMRLETTSLTADRVRPRLDALERRLRHVFFEGGRRIALSGAQREGLLRDGLPGLLSVRRASDAGVWAAVRPGDAAPGRIHGASYPTRTADAFRDWIGSAGGTSHDSIIGSVGGGNHFAELQYVAKVHDRQAAYAWGFRPGQVVSMTHSGSLSLGHQANASGLTRAKARWPVRLPEPRNKLFPLPLDDEAACRDYLDVFGNAANFAVGNRFFLALMLRTALAAECGDFASGLVYDAPHNLLWRGADGHVVHRKGATPAGGHAAMADGPYAMWGEPVIVPGSMGAASYVLRGTGAARTLASACHGAGRRVPRGAASRAGDAELDAFLHEFRVVTPLDHRAPGIARRADVLAAWRRDLKQEAPWVYKDIGPVVASLERGGVAVPVVELRPLLTVKG
ncbi:RtcB family protein [Actinomadura rayongensis]|uniref:tRNA-splicing ligase RtcB n=1 Tax=Actinomadura rayongensis TaxID=1429076 RepID=A0A6I4WAJ2_9ACTN|nr:RtcB family protein [Actinomadura rayongensis]MXQ67217.1 RtcB family protein [Actinomadura rayongensis]